MMPHMQGLLGADEEELESHLEGHLAPRQRFLGWRHRRGKHPTEHRSCVLGPQVVGGQGYTRGPPYQLQVIPTFLQAWGQVLWTCCYRPSVGLTVAGRSSLEEGKVLRICQGT